MEKVSKAAASVFAKLDPRWSEMIKGISESSAVPLPEIMFGNSFLDVGSSCLACRTAVAKGPDGRLLHARNLDWSLGSAGDGLLVLFREPASEGRLPCLRLAFPGMAGALDVVNSKGLILSFNLLGSSARAPEELVFIKMREIAETCSNFEDARAKILGMKPGMPFCITLSDAASGKSAVYERLRDGVEIKERLPLDGVLVADNSPWHGKESLMKSRCGVMRAAMEIKPSDVESLKRLMADKRVLLGCNIYSAVFDFKGNALHLAWSSPPAAKGPWVSVPLFEGPGG